MTCCPVCQREVDRLDPLTIVQSLGLYGHQAGIAGTLVRQFGKWVESEYLIERMYEGTSWLAEGPVEVLAVSVHRLRQKLKPFGIGIESKAGNRYGSGMRRMYWLPTEVIPPQRRKP